MKKVHPFYLIVLFALVTFSCSKESSIDSPKSEFEILCEDLGINKDDYNYFSSTERNSDFDTNSIVICGVKRGTDDLYVWLYDKESKRLYTYHSKINLDITYNKGYGDYLNLSMRYMKFRGLV